jgi:predicted membrane metal-binding protein
LQHSDEIAVKISDKIKMFGFSTGRVVLILDVINIAFCISCRILEENYFHYSLGNECGPVASTLFLMALILCFLPRYDNFKLLVCWPLTALILVSMILYLS